MFIWHDWEFLERGPAYPIMPISVGMVREDNQRLYLINGEFPIDEFVHHDWLREHVVPHLPVAWSPGVRIDPRDGSLTDGYEWDEDHEDYDHVWNLTIIREKVEAFILGDDPEADPPELWGWQSAYDHVCLSQLWGEMGNMPRAIPRHTKDARQVADMIGVTVDTHWGDGKHHALNCALWARDTFIDIMDTAMRLTMQAFGTAGNRRLF